MDYCLWKRYPPANHYFWNKAEEEYIKIVEKEEKNVQSIQKEEVSFLS